MARPTAHLIVSSGLATIQWIRTGRLLPTILPFVSGVLVDADHFFDFARYKLSGGKVRGKVVLPLHGWEYLVALVLIERLFGRRLAAGLLLGYLAHLALDQVTNTTTHPLTYFISYRWWRGFPSTLFSHRDESDIDWMQGGVLDLWQHF